MDTAVSLKKSSPTGWVTVPSSDWGQSEQYHDSPSPRKESGWGVGKSWRAQFFFSPERICTSGRETVLAHESEMHVSHICIVINKTTWFHWASAHFITTEKWGKFLSSVRFYKWSVTDGSCPHQVCGAWRSCSLFCQQPRRESSCQAHRLLQWFTTSKCYPWQQI